MYPKKTFTFDLILEGLGSILFESIKIPFGIFDKDLRALWVNEALASMHQVMPKKLIGNICHEVIHRRKEPCRDCPVQKACQTGKIQIAEKWYELPDGRKVWGEVHTYPVRGDDGDVAAIITFGFDVTDRKNREEVLRNYSKYLSEKLDLTKNPSQTIRPGSGEVAITVKLSGREREILRLLTEGHTNKQIGSLLSISSNTVKTHVNSIFNKLGVNDRTQAAVIATRKNMV